MIVVELIGRVAAAYIAKHTRAPESAEGVSRFLLSSLTRPQVIAIAHAILSDNTLKDNARVRIPNAIGEGSDLPPDVLTRERATYWRNRDCDRRILVLANSDDDQGQSLRDLTRVGTEELLAQPELWVDILASDLPVATNRIHWTKALEGLRAASPISLERFAQYAISTHQAIERDGKPLELALGWALPALRWPRDSLVFRSIKEKALGHKDAWRKCYHSIFTRRVPYLGKNDTKQQAIARETLERRWDEIQSEIRPEIHGTIEQFLATDAEWSLAVQAFAELEWQSDRTQELFEQLRVSKEPLGTRTKQFFEATGEERLSPDQIAYFDALDQRKDYNEDDEKFFAENRTRLAEDRKLKADWDKFIFGRPIEATDLRIGILRALEHVFGQAAGHPNGEFRELSIESSRTTRKAWDEMNDDAIDYFRTRYRGLKSLFGPNVIWRPEHLFIDTDQSPPHRRKNVSVSKNATQLKLTVMLCVASGSEEKTFQSQIVWIFDPKTVLSASADDWRRLAKSPFMRSRIRREPINSKGRLQAMNLHDVATMQAVFRQDRGSMIPKTEKSQDIDLAFCDTLAEATKRERVSIAGSKVIGDAWSRFTTTYRIAINEYLEVGSASPNILAAANEYAHVFQALAEHAKGDKLREDLWRLVLDVGLTHVDGGEPAAVVPPWHPMRFAATAIKDRRLAVLVRHLLNAKEVQFGDDRLFFRECENEMEHSFYPEVCLSAKDCKAELLIASDHCGEYSLMELPTRTRDQNESTNDDPTESARVIRDIVDHFLELYPHERANLTVVLFNCDVARLPEATVGVLSEISQDEREHEVRCHVQLRHTDPKKLQHLFESLLASSERDVDSVVTSESARDFMARLRVGIMADQAPVGKRVDSVPTDIVFLQDAIARSAEVVWVEETGTNRSRDLVEHVPSRWSRRKPASIDDLRSTTYLCCPLQPELGWGYLRAIHSILQGVEAASDKFPIPARQITFNNNSASEILDEAHQLGHWVVNYDEILSHQQLRSRNVRIIRHKQPRKTTRSIIISSTAPLSVLEVLVRRHLETFNLELNEDQLTSLTRRLLESAMGLSGDIVLRAARRAAFAHELIGIALSRFLLEHELRPGVRAGWYFLDDYAEWLGEREQQIADILAIAPEQIGDRLRLTVLVSEAKYVTIEALAAEGLKSQKQLQQTIARIEDALFGDPGRLDRDHWLARFADLLLTGLELGASESKQLFDWQNAIRDGNIDIVLRGYSHVFCHTKRPEDSDPSECVKIRNIDIGFRETYGPDQVRDLLLAFHHGRSPQMVRQAVNVETPWTNESARELAKRVEWSEYFSQLDSTTHSSETAFSLETSTARAVRRGRKPKQVSDSKIATVQPPAAKTPTVLSARPVATEAPPLIEQSAEAISQFHWAAPLVRSALNETLGVTAQESGAQAWLERTSLALRSALIGYGLEAKVVDSRLTPNAALIRFRGNDSLHKDAVESFTKKLLTTHALRVIRVAAEPGAVAIFVARPERQIVTLTEVLKSRDVDDATTRTNRKLVVGVRESDGLTLYLHPGATHAPHTLVAGTTGSGKSILIQNLILDIAMTNSTANARISIIDPKHGVDYQAIEKLPHIHNGLITEQAAALELLNALATEMDERYRKFKALDKGVSNLAGYNQHVAVQDRLPVWWMVHDEFAEWMLQNEYKEGVTALVQRLGVKARAAGIFLIFAAQRPENNVLPVNLRDNLGNRLILRVESEGTSLISLGERGAERLLGKGHLAAKLEGVEGITLAQVPMLRHEALQRVVDAIVESERSGR